LAKKGFDGKQVNRFADIAERFCGSIEHSAALAECSTILKECSNGLAERFVSPEEGSADAAKRSASPIELSDNSVKYLFALQECFSVREKLPVVIKKRFSDK